MAASYPGSVKSFTNKSNGQAIEASHVNDLQDEVNAIEAGLLNGTAPLTSSRAIVGALSAAASTLASLVVPGGSTLANLQAGNSTLTRLSLSSAAPATPAANTLYRNTIVKAWGVVDGSQGFGYGVNVASVSSNGSTAVTVTFTTALASSEYVVMTVARASSGNFFIRGKDTGGFVIASHGAWSLMDFTVIGG